MAPKCKQGDFSLVLHLLEWTIGFRRSCHINCGTIAINLLYGEVEKSILNGDTWLGGAGYRWVGKGVRGVVGWGGVWGVGGIFARYVSGKSVGGCLSWAWVNWTRNDWFPLKNLGDIKINTWHPSWVRCVYQQQRRQLQERDTSHSVS